MILTAQLKERGTVSGGVSMVKAELRQIGEYAKRDALKAEERKLLSMLLLKWMYEQRMLD